MLDNENYIILFSATIKNHSNRYFEIFKLSINYNLMKTFYYSCERYTNFQKLLAVAFFVFQLYFKFK